jgi:DNA polymerase-3 subunit alpha
MTAIKNVGVHAVEEIKRVREDLGREFTSIYDFCANVDTRIVNKRALEGLVLAGALDGLKGYRAQNFEAIEKAITFGSKVKNAKDSQVGGLFSDTDDFEIVEPELPNIPPWRTKNRLMKERQVLGFYLSSHPLLKFSAEYDSFATVHLGESETFKGKNYVRACGVVTDMRTKIDKSGRVMAFFKMDDFTGSSECLMFAKVYQKYGELLEPEARILVKATPESSGDEIKLHVDEAYSLNDVKFVFSKRIIIYMHSDTHSTETVSYLKNILEQYQGNLPVIIRVVDSGVKRDFHVDFQIKLCEKLLKEIHLLLGKNSVRYSAL